MLGPYIKDYAKYKAFPEKKRSKIFDTRCDLGVFWPYCKLAELVL